MATVILSGTNTDLSNTANWSTGALPSNGDDVILRNRTASFTTGLSALASIALASFKVESTFTGALGTSTTPAEIDADVFSWSGGSGYIDFGAATITTITVTATATAGLVIEGADIQTVYVLGGTVVFDGATVDLGLIVGSLGAATPAVTLSAVTVADITINSGAVSITDTSPSGAVLVAGGVYTATGTSNHTGTVVVSGGSFVDQTSGSTIDDLTISGQTAVYDASQSPQPKTVTACDFVSGNIKQINGNVTFTSLTLSGNNVSGF